MPATKEPDCRCCKTKREGRRLAPAKMTQLPKLLKKGTIAYACEECDGPVVGLGSRKVLTTDLNLEESTRPEDES